MGKKFVAIIILAILAAVFMFTSCSGQGEPPEAAIKINSKDIELERGSYQWTSRYMLSYNTVGTDAASPSQMAEHIKAVQINKKSFGLLSFKSHFPPEIHAYLWKKEDRGKELTIKNNQLTLPTEKGRHVIEIEAQWQNGDVSYTFVVEVK